MLAGGDRPVIQAADYPTCPVWRHRSMEVNMRLPLISRATWLALMCSLLIVASAFAAPANLGDSPAGQAA